MSSARKCDVCGIMASNVCCENCKKNFCGKKHLKSHTSSCFPNTNDLSTEEVERIEKLAIDMEEASFEIFCETLKDMMQWSR
jgi:purine-nucleoside phosphorylase